MRGLIIGAVLLFAVPAQAQTTACGWEAGKWVCREQHDYNADYAATQRQIQENSNRYFDTLRQRQAAGRAANEAQMAAGYQAVIRQQVTDAVVAGKCDDAKAIALNHGDMDLAEQATRLCTPI